MENVLHHTRIFYPVEAGHGNRMKRQNLRYNRIFVWIGVLIFSSCVPAILIAQTTPQKYLIRQISFEGNLKTQSSRLLREVTVQVGDSLTLKQVTQSLKESKEH